MARTKGAEREQGRERERVEESFKEGNLKISWGKRKEKKRREEERGRHDERETVSENGFPRSWISG